MLVLSATKGNADDDDDDDIGRAARARSTRSNAKATIDATTTTATTSARRVQQPKALFSNVLMQVLGESDRVYLGLVLVFE